LLGIAQANPVSGAERSPRRYNPAQPHWISMAGNIMQPDRQLTHNSTSFYSAIRPILTLAIIAAAVIATGLITSPAASAQTDQETMPATVMLTKDDVERFLDTLPELNEIGLHVIESSGTDSTGMSQMSAAIGQQDEALAILEKHGFDVPEFRNIGYNVMMAYAAGELENSDVEIAAARDQFASLQGMIPAEQYQMLDEQMGNMQQAIESQPEANIELVREYKSRIAAATN